MASDCLILRALQLDNLPYEVLMTILLSTTCQRLGVESLTDNRHVVSLNIALLSVCQRFHYILTTPYFRRLIRRQIKGTHKRVSDVSSRC